MLILIRDGITRIQGKIQEEKTKLHSASDLSFTLIGHHQEA